MRLVLLGAPGSGKGTQATRLKEALNVPHISTGELLRAAVAAGTPLGVKAKEVMAAGNLVSDDIVLGMLEERLGQADVKAGFILDGYPRNLAQANALDGLLARLQQPVDVAVQLDVGTDLLIQRRLAPNVRQALVDYLKKNDSGVIGNFTLDATTKDKKGRGLIHLLLSRPECQNF